MLILMALLSLLQQPAEPQYGLGLLLAAGACLLLGLAGFSFGRTTVDWRLDRYNERVPSSDGCDYDDSDMTGMYDGESSALGSCAAWWSERPALSGCGSMLSAVLGILLALAASGALNWENFTLWWALIPIAAGYVIGRLTDTGPVGPLK